MNPEDQNEPEEAVRHLSEQLGHSNGKITNAYASSEALQGGTQDKQLRSYLQALQSEEVMEHLAQNCIERAWITGAAGQGLPVSAQRPLELVVRHSPNPWEFLAAGGELQDVLNTILPFPVTLFAIMLPDDDADDGVEVKIRRPGEHQEASRPV